MEMKMNTTDYKFGRHLTSKPQRSSKPLYAKFNVNRIDFKGVINLLLIVNF